MKPATDDRLILGAFLILFAIIVVLCLELSRAWQHERFLDATINSYTTTRTNK